MPSPIPIYRSGLRRRALRRCRALRLAADMTQQEVAKKARLSQTSVSATERGFSSRGVLEALADFFGFKEDPARLLDIVKVDFVMDTLGEAPPLDDFRDVPEPKR